MQAEKRERYRQKLTRMRERLVTEAQHVAEAIQQDANPVSDVSSVPVHLADVATEALDADIRVLDTERAMIDGIVAALARLDDGTFGTCQQCGGAIGEARLDAVPYADACIDCAKLREEAEAHRSPN
jgi:DnaK suppressor protein